MSALFKNGLFSVVACGLLLAGCAAPSSENDFTNSVTDYRYTPSTLDQAFQGPAIDPGFFFAVELDTATTDYEPDYPPFWTSTSTYVDTDSPEYRDTWLVAFGSSNEFSLDDTRWQ